MTIAFELFVLALSVSMLAFLTYKGYANKDAALAWIGSTLGVISSVLFFVGYFGEHGFPSVMVDVLVFVAVIGGCAALTGGIVYAMRRRGTDTPETAEAPTQNNYVPNATTHVYGSYTKADIDAARQRAQQLRREVRA